jgi:hypothetical protein
MDPPVLINVRRIIQFNLNMILMSPCHILPGYFLHLYSLTYVHDFFINN